MTRAVLPSHQDLLTEAANRSNRNKDQAQQQQNQQSQSQSAIEDATDPSENSYSGTPPGPVGQQGQPQQQQQSLPTNAERLSSHGPSTVKSVDSDISSRPNQSTIRVGITLYFRYCHRQPIWCFERDEVNDYSSIPEELCNSILALTSRFSDGLDKSQMYANNAKSMILRRIANGTVELPTIESLCLLSFSSFIGKIMLFLIFRVFYDEIFQYMLNF